jgi:acylaminoacyl-peptidase
LRWNQQIFSGAGYAVVSINPTGSTGYGAEFTRAILGNWGSLPYQGINRYFFDDIDLINGLDYVLAEYPFIDPSRVAGLGASFGGYMVNWINGHTDRFACLGNRVCN